MTVFLIVGHIYLVGMSLCAALARHALSGALFLRDHCLQFQFAKLHVGTYTKEARCTVDQRVVRGEGHITGLHQFDNLVLLAVVLQFQVLRIKVEGGIGVIVKVHIHLVAHLAINAQVYLLVEVKGLGLPVPDGQARIVNILQRGTNLQFGRTLSLHSHTAGTEYLLGRAQVEVHV